MGVFDLLRSMLGFDDPGDSKERPGTTVAAETEQDPNGVDADGRDHGLSDVDPGDDTATGPDSAAPPDSTAETTADPAGTAGATEHSDTGAPAADPTRTADTVPDQREDTDTSEDGSTADKSHAADADDEHGVAAPVQTINGIGPAYADRLGNAGVETVPELREADAVSLAEATDISKKRISRWQERADE
ncbi:uncharacterized protein Nmlp_1105 [Natronomonas moolapensis 8.8.11]|uniref:Helix-hairpin-helix domain-containing protein n=1 Tax=Natronomonas moolapensis (strain DSM 18674 / CECT 7526 / JCM 14361 / 8.8.11) TaxID=268739 RepID=M1XK60_NATM8|nr:helix-hairpin-helix domain-containing protein [Natronomonas moolapensis]CCQ35316.1 uncharacterized protein Nmlp_1105 [Natronomonas moolapensis 8.8.11]